MKKVKMKSVIILVIIILVLVIGGIVGFKTYQYYKSNEYALKKLGYNEKDIETIVKMKKEYLNTILDIDYNKDVVNLFQSKYFMLKNLNRYLSYKEEKEDKDISDVISIVNVGADKEWYTDPVKTDMEKGYSILVNKFYYLDPEHKPDDLVTMGLQYAFTGKQIRKEIYDNFKGLVNSAKKEGLTIIANSTYRDNAYQESLYTRYKNEHGQKYADDYAARPGHSEHQTGLAIDVSTLKSTMENFEETQEFTWLQSHAHEFGFILRFPKGKEYLTGYNYESWHYRYVGVDMATEIHELGITFDEYYAYYLDK